MDPKRLLSPTASRLEPLEKRVYQKLKVLRSQLEKQTLLVAVSGGLDSVVLLHVLHSLRERLQIKLHLVHVNHGVRGKDSDHDSHFVAALAKKMGLPVTRKKIKGDMSGAGENLLRRLRYEILFAVKDQVKATFVLTAHHQDDLLETRLMRLLQGTGIHGLKAMTILDQDRLLRPLLDVKRKEIEEYAKSKKIQWRNDATNLDTTKLRNWIRRNWLGVLRAEHPEYVQNLFDGLERLVQNNPPLPKLTDKNFDRTKLAGDSRPPAGETDNLVYNYLRHYAKARVTSKHVAEFKKRLASKRKKFSFRLAGALWRVEGSQVFPV